MHGPYTFSKRDRLQRGHEFRRVYEQGRKVVSGLVVLYVLDRPPAPPVNQPPHRCSSGPATRRVGIVTSRKIGNAVQRNRARRLLREAYRLNRHKLRTDIELVLVARKAINDKKLRDVEAALGSVFAGAGLIAT